MKTRFLSPAFILLILSTLFPIAANAYDMSAKPIGSITRWQTDNGNTSIKVLGRDGRLYKLAFTRDNSKGQPLSGIFLTRKDGQTVKFIDSSGEWTRYIPHNCELTLGKCRYTEKRSDGQERKVIQIASMKDGVITYALYHTRIDPANLIEKGHFTVDRFGFDIDREYTVYDRDFTPRGYKRRWARRIRETDSGS